MLSALSLKKIDTAVAKYPAGQKQSAVMAALALAQEEKGHLSTEVMDFVASYLGIAPVAVYEVATFYGMYDLAPVGKHKLCVCTNLPCALSGAVEAAEHLKKNWVSTGTRPRPTVASHSNRVSASEPVGTLPWCWSTTRR